MASVNNVVSPCGSTPLCIDGIVGGKPPRTVPKVPNPYLIKQLPPRYPKPRKNVYVIPRSKMKFLAQTYSNPKGRFSSKSSFKVTSSNRYGESFHL